MDFSVLGTGHGGSFDRDFVRRYSKIDCDKKTFIGHSHSNVDLSFYEHTFTASYGLVVGCVSIFWILVIVAVAVAPLVSALPSESQRYEAKIRDHAMQSGLLVKLERPPEVPARFRVSRDNNLVAYRFRRAKPEPSFSESVLAVKSESTWVSVPLEKDLTAVMPLLPSGAHIVELSEFTVSIYWDEKGDTEAVDCVADALRSLFDYRGFE